MPGKDKSGKKRQVLITCALAPVIVLLVLWRTYAVNNGRIFFGVPSHGVPPDNALTYFLQAAELAGRMNHRVPHAEMGSAGQQFTLVNCRLCFRDAAPAMRIFKLGLTRHYMTPPRRGSDRRQYAESASLKELESVLVTCAEYYALTGDAYRAVQTHLDGLEMALLIPRGGSLADGETAAACESISEYRLERLLPLLTAAQLSQAAGRLKRIAFNRVPYTEIIKEEGYVNTSFLIEWLQLPATRSNPYGAYNSLPQLAASATGSTGVPGHAPSWRAALGFAFCNKSGLVMTNMSWFLELSKEARTPYRGPSRVNSPDSIYTRSYENHLRTARARFAGRDAALTVLQVELALYRYRKAMGAFPADVQQLAPRFLPAIPADPCGGASLRYTRLRGGKDFKLYSIGPDLVDDGGSLADVGESHGDIVAGAVYR